MPTFIKGIYFYKKGELMKKSMTKIVKAVLGLTMSVGMGVGAAMSSPNVNPVCAIEQTVSWTASQQGYTNGEGVSSATIDTYVSITFTDGGTATAYYDTGSAVRIYNGGTFTVSVSNGSMSNIVLGYELNGTATISCNDSTHWTAGTKTWSGDATSVTWTAGTAKHIRLSSVTVTYDTGGSTPTYSVTYHGTNKTSGSVPTDNNTYETGNSVSVLGNTGSLERTGYTWSGWSLNEDGSGTAYGPSYITTYSVASSNVNFYPIWIKNVVALPESGTISITGSHPTIGAYGTDVPYVVEEDNTPDSQFGFNCTQVMKNNDDLQFRHNSGGIGVLYSTTPLSYLRNVVVSGSNSEDAEIRYGTSQNEGCDQESIGTRNTYFKITNNGSGARYWTITVTYALEDPASLTGLEITAGASSVKKVYDDSEAFDPTGLVIKAEWDHVLDEDNDVADDVVWTPEPLTAGTESVTGTYKFGSETAEVVVSGLTVRAPDFTHTYSSNSVYNETSGNSSQERTHTPTSGPEYITLGGYNYSGSDGCMSFMNVDGMYLGNNEEYSVSSVKKYIRKIVVTTTANVTSSLTMTEGQTALPDSSPVVPTASADNKTLTYVFSSGISYFKLSKSGTSYVNLKSIKVFLGSDIPVIDSVSASVKDGTYYAGTALSASDFNVTVNWTAGKEATHPVDGFTWTVNGVANGLLEEKSNNKVVITYEGIESNEFDVVGAPASAKEMIENNVSTISSLKFNYTDNYVTDTLDYDFTGISGTGYKEWSDVVGPSGVVYAGQNNANVSYIQLRNQNPAGIVTTTSSKYAKSLTVVWNSGTTSGRTIEVYGKDDEPYSGSADLYNNDSDVKGTLIGSASYDGSTSLAKVALSKTCKYIGIKATGALYLDSISIDWSADKDANPFTYTGVNIRFGGLISVAQWNALDSEADIQGYGVLCAATNDLDGQTIKQRYANAKTNENTPEQAIASICSAYNVGKKIITNKDNPATATAAQKALLGFGGEAGDYYIWTVRKPVENFTVGYHSVAFILVDGDIVFLEEIVTSAKELVIANIPSTEPSDPALPALTYVRDH